MARPKKSAVRLHEPTSRGEVGLYTLEVFLLSGPISEKFTKKNPVVSRTIKIRGDGPLKDQGVNLARRIASPKKGNRRWPRKKTHRRRASKMRRRSGGTTSQPSLPDGKNPGVETL